MRLLNVSRLLRRPVLAAGLLAASLLAPVAAEAAAPLETVTLRLDWIPSGYHAPLFLGLQRGYFSDVGIDLKIEDGKGTNVALQAVAAGNDMIGLANYATMVQATDLNIPLVGIGGLIQKLPDAMIALQGSGIKVPKDLEGHSIATSGTSSTARLFLDYLAKEKGVDIAKIKLIQTDPNGYRAALLTGRVDVISAWALSDAILVAEAKPIEPPMLFADYGFNVLGTGFVVSKTTADTKGDLLRRFMAATGKSYEAGIKEPEAAAEALASQRNSINKDAIVKQVKLLSGFLWTPNSKGHPVGWTARADWEQTVKLLSTYFQMTRAVDIDKLYTNDFIPTQ